jgi:predicted HicB family RNase H-like nuclease
VPQNWISFRLDPALHERMKAVAAAERRSMANWLATVVEKALNDAETGQFMTAGTETNQ